ncbi:outer membrane beta-barrel protein [Mucilaginibacter sp.]|uniref:outer membrane beta-barrel protein n=1 Tax=Mucilaginibacter sp. TaxID=1882438 RepID=UPI00284C93A3|nr:outer membrane beta-barrel protein [Mucilaginibacter sp.]MDR3697394.1 outer membrane beta-barrel protein [Mucilaginibacter sp.]
MKKHLTILSAILITLISLNAKAQDDKPIAKSYLTFMGGTSIPLGSFASTNYSDNKSGFAKKGTTFGLDGAVYVYKNLAIGATFSFQDQGELSQADDQTLANGYNASFTKNQTSVTSVNRYHNLNLMAGPQYSFLYKNFILDLRADAGIIKSSSTPSLIIVFDYSANSGSTYNQLSSGSTVLAYGGSAGLRYTLSDSWDVGIRINYVTSSGLKITNTGGDTGTVGRFQTTLPINEIQTTLGMTLKF